MLVNTTISLIYLKDSPPSAGLLVSNNTSVAVEMIAVAANFSNYETIYRYSPLTLWQGYGIALGLCSMCVMLGSYMISKNGVSGDMSFSQVLVTTWNSSLDELSEGSGLGGEYISQRLLRRKVQGICVLGYKVRLVVHDVRDTLLEELNSI